MKQPRSRSHIPALAALLLLAVFAVSILFTLLEGASVYRRITDRDQETWQARAAWGYIATRLRQEPRLDTVAVGSLEGLQTLELGAGEEYLTRIYCYDGALWELYAPAGLELTPADGERLMELGGMELELSGGLLQAELTTSGGAVHRLTLDVSQGEEEGL